MNPYKPGFPGYPPGYPPGFPPAIPGGAPQRGGPPAGLVPAQPQPVQRDPYQEAILAELRAMRTEQANIWRAITRADGGDNPYGYPPRPASVTEFGVGHSGPQQTFDIVAGVSNKAQLLNCIVKEIVPQGYYGMATVHIATQLGEPHTDNELPPNTMLLGLLEWQSGNAGGSEPIDLTRGAVIPCGGTTSIQLTAELVAVTQGETPLVAFAPITAEATVCWETSATKDPPMSLPAVPLVANVVSQWFEIPKQAASMLALGTPETAYATLIAEFAVGNVPGLDVVRYQVRNPFTNGCPIRSGVNFVRFLNTAPMTFVFPTFELY